MIVAHPDDETLFAGALLQYTQQRVSWNIICVTNRSDKRRHEEFKKVLHECKVPKYTMLDIEDSPDRHWICPAQDRKRLIQIITSAAKQADFLLTHGKKGEYGHPQHIWLHHVCIEAVDQLPDPSALPIMLFGSLSSAQKQAKWKIADTAAAHSKRTCISHYTSQVANLKALKKQELFTTHEMFEAYENKSVELAEELIHDLTEGLYYKPDQQRTSVKLIAGGVITDEGHRAAIQGEQEYSELYEQEHQKRPLLADFYNSRTGSNRVAKSSVHKKEQELKKFEECQYELNHQTFRGIVFGEVTRYAILYST